MPTTQPESMERKSNMTEFILLGLTQNLELLICCVFNHHLITLAGNLLISVTIFISPTLSSPMYFFLSFLSIMGGLFSSSIKPKLILDLISQKKTISFNGCMIQLFVEHFFAGTEVILLMVMAYDCYVAICKPLHYITTRSRPVCSFLVGMAGIWGLIHGGIQNLWMIQLPFCGPNVTEHFLCDLLPLPELACPDMGPLIAANSGLHCLLIFCMLISSNILILQTLRTHSSKGHRKALFTCASHVTVVILFFVPCSFLYLRPVTSFPTDKAVAMFYTLITHMLNPLIYTLRNAEVKSVMKKLWHQIMKREDQ